MGKKYELTEETKEFYGRTLHRIKALKNFGDVEVGDLGGYIESESNLIQEGCAWVYGDAMVYRNSKRLSGSRSVLISTRALMPG